MSINIKELIREKFWRWVCKNAEPDEAPEAGAFWVNPLPEDDPGFASVRVEEVDFLSRISFIEPWSSHHVSGLRFWVGGTCFFCVGDFAGADVLADKYPDEYVECGVDFLLAALVVTRLDLKAARQFSRRQLAEFGKGATLAGDFLPHMPRLRLIAIVGEARGWGLPAMVASIYADAFSVRNGGWLSTESREVLVSIPGAGHDWLFHEFIEVLASYHYPAMYLSVYRIVEFFFPLQGVRDLRANMGVRQDLLPILERCRSDLGWYWQHGRSAKACARLAPSGAFLTPLITAGLLAQDRPVGADGAEKLVNLRNELAHQNFRHTEFDENVLRAAIEAALLFCAEAFRSYAAWVAEEAKAPL